MGPEGLGPREVQVTAVSVCFGTGGTWAAALDKESMTDEAFKTALREIAELLSGYAYTFDCEASLQAGVAAVLEAGGVKNDREERLGAGDRIDFWCWQEDIGVECKIDGPSMAVTRQLLRYANHDKVRGLILVTSRMRHKEVPTTLNGIPVELVCIAEGAL